MSRFNTGNPLGSGSPLDLDDNAKNLDLAVNAEQDTFQDRLGRPRKTYHGMEVEFEAAQQWREENFNATQSGELTNRAESAATSAETARDAAFINADVYPDVAAGRAAVADGEQFQVVEGDEIVRYRRDSASAQTEVARYPTGAAFSEVADRFTINLGTKSLHVFADDEGKVLAHIDPQGGLNLHGAKRTVQEGIAYAPEEGASGQYLHQWAGSDGNPVMALGKDGGLCAGSSRPLQNVFAGSDVVTGLEYRAQNNENLARLYFDKGKYGSRIPFRAEKRVFGFNEDPSVAKSRFAQAVPIDANSGVVFFCQQNANFQNGSENAQRVCCRSYALESDGSISLGSIVVIDEPALWATGRGYSCEPFGLRLDSGRIVLMLRRNDNANGGLRDPLDPNIFNIYSTHSDDGGVTWSTPELTVPHDGVDKAAAGQLIKTSTGRLVYPCYDPAKKIFSIFSDDDGVSWDIGNILTTANLFTEPAIIEQSDGTLLILARMGYDFNRLFRGVFKSVDDGVTWTFEGENTSAAFTASNTALIKTDWGGAGFPKVVAGSSADDRGGTASRQIYRFRFSYDDGETFIAEAAPFPDEQITGYSHISHIGEDMFILAFETASPLSSTATEGDINTRNCTAIMIFNLAEVFKNVTHP